ncbi:uncharacterized protein [Chironomus tepperi]|uniref:uncharacterized protein n=1 Tax=Chironomus tepperi TaxID=113505 RepID=UPI00391EEBE2
MFNRKLLIFVPLLLFITMCIAQQVLYQGVETDKSKQPKHNRQPIESEKCLEGEFLYPGDNEKDWVCDCKPIYVYHPETMKCYQVFEQGPCKNGEILVLPPKKASPKCIRNTCGGKKVTFKGRCVNLNENLGCPKHLFVQVDPSSLQLNCSFNLGVRFDDETPSAPLDYNLLSVDDKGSYCLPGGKRSQEEKCIDTPV